MFECLRNVEGLFDGVNDPIKNTMGSFVGSAPVGVYLVLHARVYATPLRRCKAFRVRLREKNKQHHLHEEIVIL